MSTNKNTNKYSRNCLFFRKMINNYTQINIIHLSKRLLAYSEHRPRAPQSSPKSKMSDTQPHFPLMELPTVALFVIFSLLRSSDLMSLAQTSKYFYETISSSKKSILCSKTHQNRQDLHEFIMARFPVFAMKDFWSTLRILEFKLPKSQKLEMLVFKESQIVTLRVMSENNCLPEFWNNLQKNYEQWSETLSDPRLYELFKSHTGSVWQEVIKLILKSDEVYSVNEIRRMIRQKMRDTSLYDGNTYLDGLLIEQNHSLTFCHNHGVFELYDGSAKSCIKGLTYEEELERDQLIHDAYDDEEYYRQMDEEAAAQHTAFGYDDVYAQQTAFGYDDVYAQHTAEDEEYYRKWDEMEARLYQIEQRLSLARELDPISVEPETTHCKADTKRVCVTTDKSRIDKTKQKNCRKSRMLDRSAGKTKDRARVTGDFRLF
jgi:hypothetical protein